MNRFDYEAAEFKYGYRIFDRLDPTFEGFATRCDTAEAIVKALNAVATARAEVVRMCAAARAA